MNWLASLHSQCLHFQSMARSWLCRGSPFSRPSFAVTSASTTPVTTSRTASWATCTHGLFNEMYIRLKCIHKTDQCSRYFLIKAEKYLIFMETGEEQKDALKPIY